MSRRFSVWQKVAALAPLLFLAVCLPGEIMVRCHMDGLLRPAPCCVHESPRADAGPALKARDCCDREVTAAHRPVFEAARATGDEHISLAALMPCMTGPADAASPRVQAGGFLQRHGPAREGPSIVLAKHAFLI